MQQGLVNVDVQNEAMGMRNRMTHNVASVEVNELVFCSIISHMCIDTTTCATFDVADHSVISDACTTCSLIFDEYLVKAADTHVSLIATQAHRLPQF